MSEMPQLPSTSLFLPASTSVSGKRVVLPDKTTEAEEGGMSDFFRQLSPGDAVHILVPNE